jgi:hypothetical protein
VFSVLSDVDRHVEWQDGIIESAWTSEPPGVVGARYRFVTRFAGSRMTLPGEVTGWDPPNGWTWKATGGPFPVQGGFRLVAAAGHGTRVTMFSDSEPSGWINALRPLMKWIGERGYRRSLARLKALVEQDATSR